MTTVQILKAAAVLTSRALTNFRPMILVLKTLMLASFEDSELFHKKVRTVRRDDFAREK